MGNTTTTKGFAARRAATFLAALGALVMSSGIALMVTATPANAANAAVAAADCVPKDAYTETTDWVDQSPGEGWTQVATRVIEVQPAGWQRYSWTGGPHASNDPPAFPGADWQPNVKGDPQNIGHAGAYFQSAGNSGNGDWFYLEAVDAVTQTQYKYALDHPAVTCPEVNGPLTATATATPNTPTCANNVPSYTKSGANIEDTWTESAAPAFGTTIQVTAHAVEGAVFGPEQTTKVIDVAFPAAATGCSVSVSPPKTATEGAVVVSTPKAKAHTKAKAQSAVTPTVVEAGLGSASTDLGGEQGLALMVAGMVMLVVAGGLGLRIRVAARI